ncbi:MAG: DHH family phosphoesterase [Candidatus Helarchaeota archaeon]
MNYFDRDLITSYGIPIEFIEKVELLSERLNAWERNSKILVISHRDGDGISAASVIYQCLTNLKFRDFDIRILLSPNIDELLDYIDELKPDYVLTADIGADFEDILNDHVNDYIITDHHPCKTGIYGTQQLNPIEFGINDENDASGSSTVFLIFYPLFESEFWSTTNGKIILCYTLSGAISDFQLRPYKSPTSVNKFVLDLAVNNNAVSVKKDISIFGRSLYPVYLAIHYANIPGFEDPELSNIVINSEIDAKIDSNTWKRIIDLDDFEKAKLMEIITLRLLELNIKNPNSIIKNELVGWVYDLIGLYGFDCTYLDDGRFTLDAREILHRINYCCRRGYSDLAIELLNKKKVAPELKEQVLLFHKEGDSEVAIALDLYERGEIPLKSWNDKIILIDFSGLIFYDEVGVVAGVIMKANKNIQIILSACEKDDDFLKLSVRAKDIIWESIDDSNNLSDGRKIFQYIKEKYPDDIEFGGHRWAFSSSVKRHILDKIFEKVKDYYLKLKNPSNNQFLFQK